jgi:hypothetical protein
VHALVTTLGGEPRTINVPDEQALTPDDAVRYVVDVLGDER